MAKPQEPTAVERARALVAKGAELHNQRQVDAARLHYIAANMLVPNDSGILQNLSGALYALEHFEASASVGRRAVKANPDNPYGHCNLALALIALGQCDEAEFHIRESLKHKPEIGDFWHNLSQCFYRRNQFEDAIKMCEIALTRNPTHPIDVQNDHAMALLALGKSIEGLKAYEARWNSFIYKNPIWELGIPEWKGEDLSNAHIVAHHEQGFGDSIMLLRFIKQLEAKAKKVTLAFPPELTTLVEANFPKLDVINCMEPGNVEADFHSPMMSVWRHLRAEISDKSYLRAGASPVKLPQGRRIGLCWTSGDHGARLSRRRRVIPLELFLPLTEIPDVQVISLQKGGNADRDIPNLGGEGIFFDPMGRCADWNDTAGIIGALDLVISVDSAVAHLAGALGKPVLMLSPYTRCWRWWGETTGLPWYKNFSIFSQDSDGTWNKAVSQLTLLVKNVDLISRAA